MTPQMVALGRHAVFVEIVLRRIQPHFDGGHAFDNQLIGFGTGAADRQICATVRNIRDIDRCQHGDGD
ncbi:hypothetical protein D3C72_2488590 [compost metagenome]